MGRIGWIVVIFGGITVAGLKAGDVQAVREPLYHESLRPQCHFTARYWDEFQLHPPNHHEGWINDLNGLVYNDGVVDWHNCSGLGDGNEPPMIAFWSSTDNLNQCISYSLDKGQTWTKYDKNPVLVHPYRDPKVFWYEPDQKWVMILYGPLDKVRRVTAYGFNGESNDAHDIRDFTVGQWTCSAVRLFDDGKVICEQNAGTLQTGRRASLLTVCREESDNVYLLFSSTNLLDWTKLDSSIIRSNVPICSSWRLTVILRA